MIDFDDLNLKKFSAVLSKQFNISCSAEMGMKKLYNHKARFESCILNTYCPPPFRRKAEGHSFRLSVLPSFRPSVCPSVRPSVPLKYYVHCVRNSSYSFMPILSKLYRCFCHGLKICMWFGYYPEIIFVTFSAI